MMWKDGFSREDKVLFLCILISIFTFILAGALSREWILLPFGLIFLLFFGYFFAKEIKNLIIIRKEGIIIGDMYLKNRRIIVKERKRLVVWMM